MRKIKEDAWITRNRILDAAVACFSEQGVSRTSLDAIARKAGVTRGAIYWHFKNKVALLRAMFERLPCSLRQQAETERLREDPLGFLRAMTREFFDRVSHDPNFWQVIEIFWHKCEYVGDMAALRHKHLDEGESHIDIILRAITLAQEKGQIGTALTPHQATIGLVGLLDGLIFNWTKNRRLFSLEAYGEPILESFLRGLGAEDARQKAEDE
jgi:TetR/AcrR family acrAB operon transcriptional repressor